MNNPIPEKKIRRQAWKFYFVVAAWPVYLFVLPFIFSKWGAWTVLYMIFPVIYLFCWTGFLMHESWHRYVSSVNSPFFYTAFSYLILSDPQLYYYAHGYHHGKVHSWEDAEFHPVGEIKNRALRILYNCAEILFGVAFLFVVSSIALPRDPRFKEHYEMRKLLISVALCGCIFSGIGYLSHLAFNVTAAQIIVPFIISLWINSFFLHQSQLIEHGNLICEGSLTERNLRTRNLSAAAPLSRILLFLTHDDSREHVLHHTLAPLYLRPFPKAVPLPEKAVIITLKEYFARIVSMVTGEITRQ